MLHLDKDPRKVLGHGMGQAPSADDVLAKFKGALACPIYALPQVAKRQWQFSGPWKSADLKSTMGAQIKVLTATPPGYVQTIETEGLNQGELQTPTLICAIGVHFDADPLCWTTAGNSVNLLTAGQGKPFSPDAWTVADKTNNGTGMGAPQVAAAGATSGANMLPAILEWGWWVNKAWWHMVRGYSLRWPVGNILTIIEEQLRDTAYMPTDGQQGSSSSSEVDTDEFVRQVNDYYEANMGTLSNFISIDAVRIGSVGAAGVNNGRFAPSRDFERVGATYGGMNLRNLLQDNDEFRELTNPYLLKAGVKLGIEFDQLNQVDGDKMRGYLSATYDFGQGGPGVAAAGAVPPQIVDEGNITAGAGTSFVERTLDGLDVVQQVVGQRVPFKGGNGYVSVELKGYQMSEPLACAVMQDTTLAERLCAETGCRLGWASQ